MQALHVSWLTEWLGATHFRPPAFYALHISYRLRRVLSSDGRKAGAYISPISFTAAQLLSFQDISKPGIIGRSAKPVLLFERPAPCPSRYALRLIKGAHVYDYKPIRVCAWREEHSGAQLTECRRHYLCKPAGACCTHRRRVAQALLIDLCGPCVGSTV